MPRVLPSRSALGPRRERLAAPQRRHDRLLHVQAVLRLVPHAALRAVNHRRRHFLPAALINHRQHHIDSSRTAGTGEAIAIDFIKLVRHVEMWEFLAQRFMVFPMDRAAETVEQSGFGKHIGTGANGANRHPVKGEPPQFCDQERMVLPLNINPAAHHDIRHRTDIGDAAIGFTGMDLETAARELFDVVKNGIVKVEVNQTYALKDAAQAHRDLEARKTTGSTVLLP